MSNERLISKIHREQQKQHQRNPQVSRKMAEWKKKKKRWLSG